MNNMDKVVLGIDPGYSKKRVDLKKQIGKVFGLLTIIEEREPYYSPKGKKSARFLCKCSCGEFKIARWSHLSTGNTVSCGCRIPQKTGKNRTHGKSGEKIYNVWRGIKKRCTVKTVKNYKYYGGRGITVHKKWRDSFEIFYRYVSTLDNFNREGYTLDRINNNGNYEPGNVRWASSVQQANNRRGTIRIQFKGCEKTIRDLSEEYGVDTKIIRKRYHEGLTDEKLVEL